MLLPLAFLTGTELLWSAVAFGLVFGFLLHRGGVTDFDVIVRLFQFRDFTVIKVMMTAIAVGGVGIAVLHGQDLAQYHIKATNLLAVGLGAAIFGVGVTVESNGAVRIERPIVYPTWIDKFNGHVVRPVGQRFDPTLDASTRAALQRSLDRTRAVLGPYVFERA